MKFVIVGLGNPGPDYFNTRHNIGFEVVDALAKNLSGQFTADRLGEVAEVKYKGRTLVLLKPNTYMNLSGKAVNYWLQQSKTPIERLMVVTDDLAINFGKIRIRPKGSDGGHNGLKSIQHMLNTQEYPRLRFGIGSDFHKGQQVNYVLGKWTSEEQQLLAERITIATEAILAFTTLGLGQAMSTYNAK